jgi:F0F1-type ATP synthase assembly protein I
MANQDDPKRDDSEPDGSNLGKLATLGLEIGVGAGLGALLGIWIDRKWHSAPWGVLLGTFLGISSGMYLLIKEAVKANKN